MISDRAEGGRGGGEGEERREGAERIEEERNQRRLSAYEVGIVGRRRPVSLLYLSKNYSPWAPDPWMVARGAKRARSETADVFSKWRRISR